MGKIKNASGDPAAGRRPAVRRPPPDPWRIQTAQLAARRRLAKGSPHGFVLSCLLHLLVLAAMAAAVRPPNQGARARSLEVINVSVTEELVRPRPSRQVWPVSIAKGSADQEPQARQAVAVSVPGIPAPQGPGTTQAGKNGVFAGAAGRVGGGQLLQPITDNSPGAEFFGISATGSRFVFVVDSSGSMLLGNRWQMAVNELMQAVSRLGPNRYFYVVFFDTRPHPMFEPIQAVTRMLPANDENLKRLQQWIGTVQFGMATKPLGAIRKAISLKPDAIYLLSDGEFQDASALFLRRRKKLKPKERLVIHTVGLDSLKGRHVLERIARENGGAYRLVPGAWMAQHGQKPPRPRAGTPAEKKRRSSNKPAPKTDPLSLPGSAGNPDGPTAPQSPATAGPLKDKNNR